MKTILDPAPLGGTAAVVRNGRDVLDEAHLETCGLKRADGGLAARAGPFDEHFHLADPVLHGVARRRLRRHLGGVGGAFPGSLKARLSRRCPRQRVSLGIRNGHNGVVERRTDVRDAALDVAAVTALGPLIPARWHSILPFSLPHAYRLRRTPTVRLGPLRVRALVLV